MAGMGIDGGTMMLLIAGGIILIMGLVIWRLINKPKAQQQPITRNQYERLQTDNITSAKLNRTRNTKWIGIMGDSFHAPIPKYLKYIGDIPDARVCDIFGHVGRFRPKRWLCVPWALINNYDGKTLWIHCNGFRKDGLFFRPVLCKDTVEDKAMLEKYDKIINDHIENLLEIQSIQDLYEQIKYETLSSASHKDRPVADLQQKPENPQITETDQVVVEQEG